MSDDTTPDPMDDPLLYVARCHRDSAGRVRVMEVFYRDDGPFDVAQGDEFVTFRTTVSLEGAPPSELVILLSPERKPES